MNFSEEKLNSAIITSQARKLHKALEERGILNTLEEFDGHKHVDIFIPLADLCIEIDGKYHLTDPEQLLRDLKRDSYSFNDGKSTIHVQNDFVDRNLNELADSIVAVIKKRQRWNIL
jgi:very-short-patch-repair endonuclease